MTEYDCYVINVYGFYAFVMWDKLPKHERDRIRIKRLEWRYNISERKEKDNE